MASARKSRRRDEGSESEEDSEDGFIDMYQKMYEEMKLKLSAMESVLMTQIKRKRRKRRKLKRKESDRETERESSDGKTSDASRKAAERKDAERKDAERRKKEEEAAARKKREAEKAKREAEKLEAAKRAAAKRRAELEYEREKQAAAKREAAKRERREKRKRREAEEAAKREAEKKAAEAAKREAEKREAEERRKKQEAVKREIARKKLELRKKKEEQARKEKERLEKERLAAEKKKKEEEKQRLLEMEREAELKAKEAARRKKRKKEKKKKKEKEKEQTKVELPDVQEVMSKEDTNEMEVEGNDDKPKMEEEAKVDGEANDGEMPEDAKLWKKVKSDPTDFDSWVRLASMLEQKDDYGGFRKCLKALLKEYPLCYGYWTKLCELEKRHNHPDRQLKVCEEGIVAAAHCHEMWTYYCCMDFDAKDELLITETRRRFERAAAKVGDDFQAHSFWNKYIAFETQNEEYRRVANIYQRILGTPLSLLDEYYKKFKEFASSRPLNDLLSESESKVFDPKSVEESERQRTEIMSRYDQVYLRTSQIKAAVDVFENRISRAYFHVKEVEATDIANWHSYLDYCEKWTKQDPSRFQPTTKVYERCLVACASYPEFWNRYANFVAAHESEDKAREIFERATKIFTKRQPEAFLEYAFFEEAAGAVDHARQLYKHVLEKVSPGLTEGIINLTNFERRQGDIKLGLDILTKAMGEADDNLASLTVFAATYVRKHCSDEKKAQVFFEEAVKKVPGDLSLWLAYISMETSKLKFGFNEVKELYERALGASSLSEEDTVVLAAHYLEFAANYAKDIKVLRTVQSRFPNVSTLLVFNEKKGQDISSTQTQGQHTVVAQQTAQASQSGQAQPATATATATTTATADTAQTQSGYDQQTAEYYQQYGYGYQYPGYDYSAWQQQYGTQTAAQ